MGIVELFLIAVGLSMDAFAVAVCKGLAMKKCTWTKAGIVGLYFGVFQAGMPLIGYVLGVQFKDFITSIDHWIAFILLGIIGFNMACVPQIDTMHPLSVEGSNLTITHTQKTIGCICLGFMVFYGKTQR